MEITLYNGVKDTNPSHVTMSFAELAMATQDIWAKQPWQRSDKLQRMAMIFGHCGQRNKANVDYLEGIGADIDTAADDPKYITFHDMCDALDELGLRYIAYTTTGNHRGRNKYRLIMPYAKPVESRKAQQAWFAVNDKFGGIFDPSTKDQSRLSFLPADWIENPFKNDKGETVALDRPFNATRVRLAGRDILSVDEIEALPEIIEATQPRASITTRAMPRLTKIELSELAKSKPTDWIGWQLLSNIQRSELVSNYLRNELPNDQGSREYRFCKSVVRTAIKKQIPINHETLVDLATQWSRQYLSREPSQHIHSQAHNALAWCFVNNPSRTEFRQLNPQRK